MSRQRSLSEAVPTTSTNSGGSTSRPASALRTRVLLSEKQVNKITKSLETVRSASAVGFNSSTNFNAGRSTQSRLGRSSVLGVSTNLAVAELNEDEVLDHAGGSFYDERSYINAPLNSRVHLPSGKREASTKQGGIGSLSIPEQEMRIIDDLLFVMMGINGNYIQIIRPDDRDFDDNDAQEDMIVNVFFNDELDWDLTEYMIDPALDPSLRDLVDRIIPIATFYMSIDAFVELHSRFEYGFVSHAMCAAIRGLVKEYLIFIAQLETQHRAPDVTPFTLQKMWFYVQPTLHTMSQLHNLVQTIRVAGQKSVNDEDEVDELEQVLENLKNASMGSSPTVPDSQRGGGILTRLADRVNSLSGDPTTKALHTYLLSKASKPYLEILQAWIHHGEIRDPYSEFMIKERKNLRKENLKQDYNDSYWELRYTLCEGGGAIPPFLEPLKMKVLLAGKYLNVIRECGIQITKAPTATLSDAEEDSIATDRKLDDKKRLGVSGKARVTGGGELREPEDISGTVSRDDVLSAVDGGQFVRDLEIAYKYANRTLLDLLLADQKLMPRLRSLKHYFFLDQSDFLTPFLDVAASELKKPAREVSMTRLQSLLDLILRNPSSVASFDPFKEDVKVEMSILRLIDQLLKIISVEGLDSATATDIAARAGIQVPGPMASGRQTSASDRGDPRLNFVPPTGMADSLRSVGENSVPKDILTGFDALTLDYTVVFPLSLVISRKALTKYQLIFRHLLYLKHVEALLCVTWKEHREPLWRRTSSNSDLNIWKSRVFALRAKMLNFVQQFMYYVTTEVLEMNWVVLEERLAKVSTVDQVLQYHSDFLDTCLKECMLTNAKLLKIYQKLMQTITIFASYMERFSKFITLFESSDGTESFNQSNSVLLEPQERSLRKFEEHFETHIKLLLDALNYYSATETVQYLSLVLCLDGNLYYAKIESPLGK